MLPWHTISRLSAGPERLAKRCRVPADPVHPSSFDGVADGARPIVQKLSRQSPAEAGPADVRAGWLPRPESAIGKIRGGDAAIDVHQGPSVPLVRELLLDDSLGLAPSACARFAIARQLQAGVCQRRLVPRARPAGRSRRCWTISGTPPTAVATTGVPSAIASRIAIGIPSFSDGSTKTSIAAIRSWTSVRGPGNRQAPST